MRIRVDEIPDSGRFLRFRWDDSRLQEFMAPNDPFKLELAKPLEVKLEVQKRPDHVHVQGSIDGELRVVCHRCLEPFVWPLKENVEVFLVTEPQSDTEEEEIPLEPEDLEYEFFDGEVIEIDRLVAEQIFLALPYKVLCSEACKGLCPGCGTNLNQESCTCEKSTKGSPFEQLARIKERLP